MPPTPAIAGSTVPQTPMTSALAQGLQAPGAAQDQIRQQIETLMGQVRDVKSQVDAIAADFPTLASDAEQTGQILKRMVVNAASQAPQQTASGMGVPMGGGGGQ